MDAAVMSLRGICVMSLCSPSVWTDKTLPAESRCRREKQADKYVNVANAATCRVTTTTLKIAPAAG